MCNNPSQCGERTERESLEEALKRAEALKRDWCDDGKLILAAARKHLDTLPKPVKRARVERWLVVEPCGEVGPYLKREDAEAVARYRPGARVVALTGEYFK